jgi:hypothetical protein
MCPQELRKTTETIGNLEAENHHRYHCTVDKRSQPPQQLRTWATATTKHAPFHSISQPRCNCSHRGRTSQGRPPQSVGKTVQQVNTTERCQREHVKQAKQGRDNASPPLMATTKTPSQPQRELWGNAISLLQCNY